MLGNSEKPILLFLQESAGLHFDERIIPEIAIDVLPYHADELDADQEIG